MAAVSYEFMHVSQMLQTIFGLAVSLLAIAQFLMVRYELWTDMVKIREDEADEYDKWMQAESITRGINMEDVEDQNSMVRNVQEELNPNAMNTTEEAPAEKPEQTIDPVGETMMPPMPPAIPPVQVKLENGTEEQHDPFSEYNSAKRQSAHIYLNVTHLFDQNLPIIMCCMVLGMLTVSTYLLTAITFFCYLFFNLVFNYANLIEKLEVKVESKLVPLVLSLLASGWVVAYFGGVLIRDEYQ